MAWPADLANVLRSMGVQVGPDEGDVVIALVNGAYQIQWGAHTPVTEQAATDRANGVTVINGQTYAQWLAEHGGDPLATLRRKARRLVDSTDAQEVRSRASDIEILLYARDVCASLRQLLAGIAAANDLTDVKTAAAAITPPPAPANNAVFLAGARAAVKARIENGGADV